MGELNELEENIFEHEEIIKMPSRNHSFTQTRIAGLFFNEERFTPFVDVSLDASQIDLKQFGLKIKDEFIPDICLYPGEVGLSEPLDELKMSEMPLLAIEILSPKQGIEEVLAKFPAYFAMGIKSCWLVIPTLKTVTVYSQPTCSKFFDTQHDTEVIDEIMDIRLPIQKIFKK